MTFLYGGFTLIVEPNLTNLVIALILGSITNFFFATYHVVNHFGWNSLIPAFNKKQTKWILVTAFPFALAAAFVKIYSYIDSIFLSKMLGEYDVGIYAIAYKFTYAFQFLPMAFGAALYPNLSALSEKEGSQMGPLMRKAFLYMALLSAPIVCGIIGVAPELVLLTTEEFASAGIVLQMLVLVLIPIFLDFPIGTLLNATGRQTTKATIYGITMLINVIFNLLLIPKYFVMGAAYAALISFSALFIMGAFYVPKIIEGFSWWKTAKEILPIYASAVCMLLCVFWLKPILGWQLVMPIGAMIYTSLILLSGVISIQDLKQWRKI
jgi:O-antigen/teichoic acid export membrane protein